MHPSTALAGAALVVALGALGLALVGSQDPAAGSATGPGHIAADAAPDAAVLSRLAALERGQRDLVDRLDLADTRGVDADRVPLVDAVPREEFEAVVRELRDALAGASEDGGSNARDESVYESMWKDANRKPGADWSDPEERAVVAEKLDAKRAAELEVLETRMLKFEDQLGLDRAQSDALRSALLSQHDREAEWTRLWRDGADAEVLAEMKTNDQATHRAELESILTPEQLEQFETLNGGGSQAAKTKLF